MTVVRASAKHQDSQSDGGANIIGHVVLSRFRYFADGLKTVKEVGLRDFQKLDLKITSKRKAAPAASRLTIPSETAVVVLS